MMRTITVAVLATAYWFSGPAVATAAAGKCQSLQARCAVEIGGKCNPQTGRWCYGYHGSEDCGRSGTPQGGLTALFETVLPAERPDTNEQIGNISCLSLNCQRLDASLNTYIRPKELSNGSDSAGLQTRKW